MENDMNSLLDALEAKFQPGKDPLPILNATTLPMQVVTSHKVDYSQFALWAAKHLGIPNLEFVDVDNDSDHDFDACTRNSGKYTWSWNQEEIDATVDAAKANGHLPIHEVGNLLSYFADAGLIPEGNYIINVSW